MAEYEKRQQGKALLNLVVIGIFYTLLLSSLVNAAFDSWIIAGSGSFWCETICVNFTQASLRTKNFIQHTLHTLVHLVQQLVSQS